MKRNRHQRSKRGTTILEALMASVVFGIAMAGTVGLTQWSTTANFDGRHLTEATLLAQDKVEELRSFGLKALADGGDTVGIFERCWFVSPLNASASELHVSVHWTTPDDIHQHIDFRTVVAAQ